MESKRVEQADVPDATLVELVRKGQMAAFKTLIERYQDRVYNTIFRLVGNADDADGLLQEVFFKVYRALDGFESKASFSTWVYRIAMNHCASHLRKMKAAKRGRWLSLESLWSSREDGGAPEIAGNAPEASAALIGGERQMQIQRAITQLEPDLRRVLVLKDVDDRSYEEIADILECPVGTVKSRLFKARELLRSRLSNMLQ